MNKKAFIIIGIQGGDEGKGGVVHKFATVGTRAHTIIKVGGAQGSHGVKTSNGESFAFSQFGCGTFENVETFISSEFIMDPNALLNEGNTLIFENGVHNAFDLITVDEKSLCSTPIHRISSRLHELALRDKRRGTVGTGVGRACLDQQLYPTLAIYAEDLLKSNVELHQKIEAVRMQKLEELRDIIESVDTLLSADKAEANEMITQLKDPAFSTWITNRFLEMSRKVRIVPSSHLGEYILAKDGRIIIESSHGVLNDKYYGFHPHTTKLRVLPSCSVQLLRDAGYDGEINVIGVTRAYAIRHGAGPLVTHDPSMVETLLPGSNKDTNRFQGEVRVGALDFVALRYTIEASGGPGTFFGLAVTWFDQVKKNGTWLTCNRYHHPEKSWEFNADGNINARHMTDSDQLVRQESLGKTLGICRPLIDTLDIARLSNEELTETCCSVLEEKLNVPVRMISFGPTEMDKVLI